MSKVGRLRVPTEGLILDHKLLETLVHFTIKDGKKKLSVRLINDSINILMATIKVDLTELIKVLDDVTRKVNVKVGFFKRRIGSRRYQVPYMLTEDRSYKHSIKRLYKLVRNTQKRDYVTALSKELIAIHKQEGSLTLAEKARIFKEAKANRSSSYMISKFKVKHPENLKVDLEQLED